MAGVNGLRSSVPYRGLIVALAVVSVERRRRVAGTSSEESAPPDHLDDLPQWRRHLPWAVAGAVHHADARTSAGQAGDRPGSRVPRDHAQPDRGREPPAAALGPQDAGRRRRRHGRS
ncbi:hypothetical protein Franean1_2723 [Parafrankia sp. EAN1pec]|nr:hypothetical protein Franean1_2723 [Frankia sp. EAN1pec]